LASHRVLEKEYIKPPLDKRERKTEKEGTLSGVVKRDCKCYAGRREQTRGQGCQLVSRDKKGGKIKEGAKRSIGGGGGEDHGGGI